jgi:hypothetical protein
VQALCFSQMNGYVKTGISAVKITDVGVQKIPMQFMKFLLRDCMQSHRAYGF